MCKIISLFIMVQCKNCSVKKMKTSTLHIIATLRPRRSRRKTEVKICDDAESQRSLQVGTGQETLLKKVILMEFLKDKSSFLLKII